MGAVVTVDLPEDAPEHSQPWIITFGPIEDDESWEPVVCGPYERAHALSLAETVVADEELLAVVEPLNPFATVDQIRAEIELSRAHAVVDGDEDEDEEDADIDLEHDHEGIEEIEPTPPPSPEEIRAGFARIASRLAKVG